MSTFLLLKCTLCTSLQQQNVGEYKVSRSRVFVLSRKRNFSGFSPDLYVGCLHVDFCTLDPPTFLSQTAADK